MPKAYNIKRLNENNLKKTKKRVLEERVNEERMKEERVKAECTTEKDPNTPWAPAGPERIKVAYGKVPLRAR